MGLPCSFKKKMASSHVSACTESLKRSKPTWLLWEAYSKLKETTIWAIPWQFKGHQTMWEAWGNEQDSVRRRSLHEQEKLEKETKRFAPGQLQTWNYLISRVCSCTTLLEDQETWAIATENTAVNQEIIALLQEWQWRFQHIMLWASQYYANVFVQEQEISKASNKSWYILLTEKRNNWWIKIKNQVESE